MTDLIDREALLAAYDREHVGPPGRARKLIEEAQTIDVSVEISAQLKLIKDLQACGRSDTCCSSCSRTPSNNCGVKLAQDAADMVKRLMLRDKMLLEALDRCRQRLAEDCGMQSCTVCEYADCELNNRLQDCIALVATPQKEG